MAASRRRVPYTVPAYAALALAVFAVSWAAILIRLCEAPPLIVAFYRLSIAALCLAPFAGLHRGSRWMSDRRTLGAGLAAGVLLGLHFASWITSLSLTSVASSVVLVTTTPVFAALFSAALLGERAGAGAWAGIVLSVLGSSLVAWGDARAQSDGSGVLGGLGATALVGDALAFAGAIFVAGYFALGRMVRARAPLVPYLVLVYGVGAAAVAVGALARGDAFGGYGRREWALFVAIAVVPNVIGHSLLNWAVRRMRTYVVNVAVLGEPVLATLYAAFLFSERPGGFWAAGSALIAGGVLAVFLSEKRQARVEGEGI